MKKTSDSFNKIRKTISLILAIIVFLFLAYFALVLVYRLVTQSSAKTTASIARFMAEFGVVCLFLVPAIDIRFGLFSRKKSPISTIFCYFFRALVCTICILFIVLGVIIITVGHSNDKKETNYVCVLGLAIDKTLPQDLIFRLDKALEQKELYPDAIFIVTGGNNDDPYYTEAAYMARYLKEKGFDDSKLITEDQARTTVENFIYTSEIVDKTQPLTIITNNYHIFRSSKIAEKQGYTQIVKAPAPSNKLLYIENVTWEAICSFFETLAGDM